MHYSIAVNVFEMMKSRPDIQIILTDYARVLHAANDSSSESNNISNRLVNEMLGEECPADVDERVIGVMLKHCERNHDYSLASKV